MEGIAKSAYMVKPDMKNNCSLFWDGAVSGNVLVVSSGRIDSIGERLQVEEIDFDMPSHEEACALFEQDARLMVRDGYQMIQPRRNPSACSKCGGYADIIWVCPGCNHEYNSMTYYHESMARQAGKWPMKCEEYPQGKADGSYGGPQRLVKLDGPGCGTELVKMMYCEEDDCGHEERLDSRRNPQRKPRKGITIGDYPDPNWPTMHRWPCGTCWDKKSDKLLGCNYCGSTFCPSCAKDAGMECCGEPLGQFTPHWTLFDEHSGRPTRESGSPDWRSGKSIDDLYRSETRSNPTADVAPDYSDMYDYSDADATPYRNPGKHFICCICGVESFGYGNNPWPHCEMSRGVCCDVCNSVEVIPARMSMLGYSKNPYYPGEGSQDWKSIQDMEDAARRSGGEILRNRASSVRATHTILDMHVDETANFYRIRVRDPDFFNPKSFRVPGWAAHAAAKIAHIEGTKCTMGKLKDGDAWAIQSIMVPKGKHSKDPEVDMVNAVKMGNRIIDRLEKGVKPPKKDKPKTVDEKRADLLAQLKALETRSNPSNGDYYVAVLKKGQVMPNVLLKTKSRNEAIKYAELLWSDLDDYETVEVDMPSRGHSLWVNGEFTTRSNAYISRSGHVRRGRYQRGRGPGLHQPPVSKHDRRPPLKKTSCCCGATEENPCACMYKGVMQCSSSEPMCPCYANKRDGIRNPAGGFKRVSEDEACHVCGDTGMLWNGWGWVHQCYCPDCEACCECDSGHWNSRRNPKKIGHRYSLAGDDEEEEMLRTANLLLPALDANKIDFRYVDAFPLEGTTMSNKTCVFSGKPAEYMVMTNQGHFFITKDEYNKRTPEWDKIERRNPMPAAKSLLEWAEEEDAGRDIAYRDWMNQEQEDYYNQAYAKTGGHRNQDRVKKAKAKARGFRQWSESEIDELAHFRRNPTDIDWDDDDFEPPEYDDPMESWMEEPRKNICAAMQMEAIDLAKWGQRRSQGKIKICPTCGADATHNCSSCDWAICFDCMNNQEHKCPICGAEIDYNALEFIEMDRRNPEVDQIVKAPNCPKCNEPMRLIDQYSGWGCYSRLQSDGSTKAFIPWTCQCDGYDVKGWDDDWDSYDMVQDGSGWTMSESRDPNLVGNPYAAMHEPLVHVELHDDRLNSHKYWEAYVDGTDAVVHWGRVPGYGRSGSTQEKRYGFNSSGAAKQFIYAKVSQKKSKGYKTVG